MHDSSTETLSITVCILSNDVEDQTGATTKLCELRDLIGKSGGKVIVTEFSPGLVT